jgi:hypothetical protein
MSAPPEFEPHSPTDCRWVGASPGAEGQACPNLQGVWVAAVLRVTTDQAIQAKAAIEAALAQGAAAAVVRPSPARGCVAPGQNLG